MKNNNIEIKDVKQLKISKEQLDELIYINEEDDYRDPVSQEQLNGLAVNLVELDKMSDKIAETNEELNDEIKALYERIDNLNKKWEEE